MPSLQIGFRVPDDLLAQIDARTGGNTSERGSVFRVTADRYCHLLQDGRTIAREALSPDECGAIADVLNGIMFPEPVSVRLLWANVDDSLRHGLAEKWGIDGAALVAKLRALPLHATFAIVDAAERFWRAPGADPRWMLEG